MAGWDVIVVGAGPAGEVVAGRLGEAGGVSVALVERELVGGECAYWACMPSKALLRPGDLLAETRRVGGVRELVDEARPDARAVLARRDEVIHGLDDSGQLPWLEERGVTVLRGAARLDGERRVRVGEELHTARRAVVLATGSGAAVPPIPGLADVRPWTNREGTTAKEVPARLIVLGGGVVGSELAQAWRSLGSEVTLVEALPRLLGREEAFAAEMVRESLERHGVDVRLGVKATGARREDADVVLSLEGGAEVRGDEILVAVGRRPHTDELGLETVGLEPGRIVEVDDEMRVADRPWLFAVGDVNGRALVTHQGKHQGRIVADLILGRPARDRAPVPRVVFTDPQVAAVGHTLESAKEAGLRVRAVDHPPGAVAGASFVGRGEDSLARIVIDEERDVLVGVTFCGPEVAELLHAATIAVAAAVPLADLWQAVPAFPTRSEVWLRLLEKAGL